MEVHKFVFSHSLSVENLIRGVTGHGKTEQNLQISRIFDLTVLFFDRVLKLELTA